MERRQLLKSTGTASITLAGLSQVTVGSPDDESDTGVETQSGNQYDPPSDSPKDFWWQRNIQRPPAIGEDRVWPHVLSAYYYGSTYLPSNGKWLHDFRFGGSAHIASKGGVGGAGSLGKISFNIYGTDFADTTVDGWFGVTPIGNEEAENADVGSAAATVLGEAVDRLSPISGIAVSVAQVVEALADPGAQDEEGLSMTHNPKSCQLFGRYCTSIDTQRLTYYKRLFALEEGRGEFTIKSTCKRGIDGPGSAAGTNETSITFELWPDENEGIRLNNNEDGRTYDPRDMSEEEIKEYSVEKKSVSPAIQTQTGEQTEVESMLAREDSIYVADIPIKTNRARE